MANGAAGQNSRRELTMFQIICFIYELSRGVDTIEAIFDAPAVPRVGEGIKFFLKKDNGRSFDGVVQAVTYNTMLKMFLLDVRVSREDYEASQRGGPKPFVDQR